MAVNSTLAHGLQACIGKLMTGNDFSDFTIVVKNTSFPCHRCILSACSDFFKTMFLGEWNESITGEANFPELTTETFEIIINSIYTGEDRLTEDNVIDVWSAAHLLNIDYLVEACKQFVVHSLPIDNCFRFLNHATTYSAQEVIDSCLVFISKHFEQVRNAESFLQLQCDYFYKVIKSDVLATSSEDSVVDVILTWVEYQPDPEHCSWLYTENSACQTDSKEAHRKQHFLDLMSACRLFLANPSCLENLLKNHRDLLISTGAYNMVLNAQMYTLRVDLRHEAWPVAAMHRASSSFKHVMVFLSDYQFNAYRLDTGSVHEFAKVPEDCKNSNRIIVFDNGLYLVHQRSDGCTMLLMITKQKSWASVTGLNIYHSHMLLAHGNYIYDVEVGYNQFTLSRWSYAHGHSKWMTQTCATRVTGNILVRFQMYIVVFITENWVVSAHCFNTKTDQVHVCTTSLNPASESMISFSSSEDVYVLEGNGSLWKVFSTDTTPVGFVLVSELFDFNCDLKGCVLYRQTLYIFYGKVDKENPNTLLTSLPGICTDIKMIQINSRSPCLPMVLPGSWLTS